MVNARRSDMRGSPERAELAVHVMVDGGFLSLIETDIAHRQEMCDVVAYSIQCVADRKVLSMAALGSGRPLQTWMEGLQGAFTWVQYKLGVGHLSGAADATGKGLTCLMGSDVGLGVTQRAGCTVSWHPEGRHGATVGPTSRAKDVWGLYRQIVLAMAESPRFVIDASRPAADVLEDADVLVLRQFAQHIEGLAREGTALVGDLMGRRLV